MFGIAWSEFLLIGIVALVVVPPKDLPKMMRTVGQWVGQMRRMASDFQYQVSSALRDAEIEDIRKSVEDMTKADPMRALREELESVSHPVNDIAGQIHQDLTSVPEVKSFPPGEPSNTPVSLEPASASDTATPPGHAAFPGAMAEAASKEAAVHDEVGERLADLAPIPVHTAPLDDHATEPALSSHAPATEPETVTDHETAVPHASVAAGSR